jgi:hypothetical protein
MATLSPTNQTHPQPPNPLSLLTHQTHPPTHTTTTTSFNADATQDALLLALRQEIYAQPYESIDWDAERHACSPLDVYDPVTPLMKGLQVRACVGGEQPPTHVAQPVCVCISQPPND